MKRGTPNHPKTLMLAMELEAIYARHRKKELCGGQAQAVGILEVLWDWASKYAIQGDIGKWPDEAIARGIGWMFPASELISALINSMWIDRAPEPHRLVIHDIKDHATNCWRQNLEDAGLTWWDGSPPRKYKLQKNSRKTPENSRKSPENYRKSPQAQPEPEPEPERTEERARSASGWQEFQEAYPVDVGIEPGCRAYMSRIETPEDHERLMAGLRRHLESEKWRNAETGEYALRFVPSMAKFIENGMYLDHPPLWMPKNGRVCETRPLPRAEPKCKQCDDYGWIIPAQRKGESTADFMERAEREKRPCECAAVEAK